MIRIIDNLKTLSKEFGAIWSCGFRSKIENNRYVIETKGYVTKQTDSTSTANLSLINGFVKRDEAASSTHNYIYGISTTGKIWKFNENDPTVLTNPHSDAGTASLHPDIVIDDDNDLYWTSAQYLGKFTTKSVTDDTFTGSGLDDLTAGGTSTTNDVVNYKVEIDATGTPDTFKWSDDGGTTWDATGVAITGAAQTLNNGVTVTFTATTGHTLADYWTFSTGLWNDQFADFTSGLDSTYGSGSGASDSTAIRRPFIKFDDTIYIGNKDYLAKIDSDGDNFDSNFKQLPLKYQVVCGAANGVNILVGGRKFNKGLLLLWNPTNASSTWDNKLYLDNDIYAIQSYKDGWVFAAGGGIYFTNGQSIELLDYLPTASFNANLNIDFNSMIVVDDKVIFTSIINPYAGLKGGFYVYDIKKENFDFIPNHSKEISSGIYQSLYYNAKMKNILSSYSYDVGNKYALSTLSTENHRVGDKSIYITRKILFNNEIKLNKVKLNYSFNDDYYNNYANKSLDITVRVANASDKLWTYASTNSASSSANEIQVDGSVSGVNNAVVGDQIMILNDSNALESSQLSSIANAGTNTELWTLEDSLTNLTENGVTINVLPFKKFAQKTSTNTNELVFVNNEDLSLSNEIYVQIEVSNTNFPITINKIILDYEPRG